MKLRLKIIAACTLAQDHADHLSPRATIEVHYARQCVDALPMEVGSGSGGVALGVSKL
jgi:hypothetical protein